MIEKHEAVMVLNSDMGHALIVEASKRWKRCPYLKLSREGAGFFVANAFFDRTAPDHIRRKIRKGCVFGCSICTICLHHIINTLKCGSCQTILISR